MLNSPTITTFDQLLRFALISDAQFKVEAQQGDRLEALLLSVLIDEIQNKLSTEDTLDLIGATQANTWVGVDTATLTELDALYGRIYAVDLTTNNLTITIPDEPPERSAEIGIFDVRNNFSAPNTLTVVANANYRFNGQPPPFTSTQPGNNNILRFVRLEDPLNEGQYLNNFAVYETGQATFEIIPANRADNPNPAQYKIWIVLDENVVEFSDGQSWNVFAGFED